MWETGQGGGGWGHGTEGGVTGEGARGDGMKSWRAGRGYRMKQRRRSRFLEIGYSCRGQGGMSTESTGEAWVVGHKVELWVDKPKRRNCGKDVRSGIKTPGNKSQEPGALWAWCVLRLCLFQVLRNNYRLCTLFPPW